ncbi:MAG: FtsX-like permease family protein [Coriobacteriales bacterium]|nr:ABC transporter permease [Actinomycetes bacterium]
MRSVRVTKVLRDLSSHWFRTLLVVLSIAIGVFAVGVILGGRQVLVREFDREYAASQPPNAVLYTAPFDERIVRDVLEYPGVEAALGRRSAEVRYSWRGSPGLRTLRVVAYEDLESISVQKVVPEQAGHWPPGRGEIVLESSAKQTGDYRVGDVFTIAREHDDPVGVKVVGFAHDVNAFPAQFSGAETGFVSFATLPDLGLPQTFDQLLVVFDQDGLTQRSASRVAEGIARDVFEANGIAVYATDVPKPGSHFLGDIFKAVSLLLLALGILALALSGFLVTNTVSALMAQHIKQVGIMKAVGGHASQVTAMYLGMVGVYGVMAVAIGLPAATVTGKWFIGYAADILNIRVVSHAPPGWVTALEIAVGLIVPLLAAVVPVHAGTRMSVAHALSAAGVPTTEFGHGRFDRLLGGVRGLPRPVALSLRNTFLRKGRLALTLATLTLASAVVMSVFCVQSSIDRTIDDLDAWWRYDMEIRYERPVDAQVLEREIRAVDGVSDVESWITAPTSLARADGTRNETLVTQGVPADTTFVAPSVTSGRWLEPGDTDAVVVNTDALKAEPDLGVGRRVTLAMLGRERTWRVVGVVKGQMGGPALFTTRDALATCLGDAAVSRSVVKSTTSDAQEQQQTLERIERRLEEAGYAVAETHTVADLRDQVASQLGILVSFLVIMAALLASVGVIGLTGAMSINVIESTREIGVMRAIGATHDSIYRIFTTEGLVVGLMSWALGAVVAYPLSYYLTAGLSQTIGVPLTYRFSWSGVGLWCAAIGVISIVASLAPAFRASQVSVRDAIAYE